MADIFWRSSTRRVCSALLFLLLSPIFFLCSTHCWSFIRNLSLTSSCDMAVYTDSAMEVARDYRGK